MVVPGGAGECDPTAHGRVMHNCVWMRRNVWAGCGCQLEHCFESCRAWSAWSAGGGGTAGGKPHTACMPDDRKSRPLLPADLLPKLHRPFHRPIPSSAGEIEYVRVRASGAKEGEGGWEAAHPDT